jgi:hypothetical protein
MNGSCQAGVLKLDPANTNLHSHHHHDQPQPRESGEQNSELRSKKSEVSMPGLNVPQAFVGAVAVAHGSDNDQPQTIDATSDATVYEHAADNPALSSDGNGDGKFALSAIALTKPCSAECGAGAAGFISSKRSRHASTLAVRNRAQPLITSVLPNYEPNLTCPRATFGRTTTPRGPPQLPFC